MIHAFVFYYKNVCDSRFKNEYDPSSICFSKKLFSMLLCC